LALLAVLVGLALRILRWQVLLTQGADPGTSPSQAYLAGQATTSCCPSEAVVIRLACWQGSAA
jgi:hypothetical protein